MTRTEKKIMRRHLGSALTEMQLELKKQLDVLKYGEEAMEKARQHKLSSRARIFYHIIYCNRRGEGLSKKDSDKIAYKAVIAGYENDIKTDRFLKRLEKAITDLGEKNAASVS